ncbi:hypothetical protein [Bradyrhizobium sp. AUGA SZCCT0182]|uniref:hypothetical protein n=1 Tax=Bradyrhizobium sp. AUGA SZCCT0182 TaxID=2807667 RepID=UPI001BA6B67D|nr:hypothetical protein [Bradyrhizobium sp. AUGA SZCCT0182]MBR1231639.1 hypothetical protein [Bradyrhizobium sp. AUGA SZCCT0182]
MPPFVIAQKLDQGTKNPIVARLRLQNFEILQKCRIAEENKEKIQNVFLSSLTPKLLRCSEILEKLRTETDKAAYKPPGPGEGAAHLPQVMRLEPECHNYLYEAKNDLRDLLQILNLLFGTGFDEASEWTMARMPRPSVIEWAAAKFGEQHDYTRYLRQLPGCIEPFIRMRNAVEHPKGPQRRAFRPEFSLRTGWYAHRARLAA